MNTGPNPSGLCLCGCGGKAPLAKQTSRRYGHIKGEPVNYIVGHKARGNPIERVMTRVDKRPGGCWYWTGLTSTGGYGRVKHENRVQQAHRVVYELLAGPIPDGLQLDHLCRNRICVNPDHLEPVTQRENLLRGVSVAAINARKSTCHRGHQFDEENTYWNTRGHRECRACHRQRQRARAAA